MARTAKSTTRKAGSTPSRRRDRPAPRQRLLGTATQLFTTEGIRVIGIDRILREADVAKASLYSLFGSKDKLVVAYLEALDEQWRASWHERSDDLSDPKLEILAFFDKAIADMPDMNYRGSHFQNAASEYPMPETETEHEIRAAAAAHRTWCLDTLRPRCAALGAENPEQLANQLLVMLDGGINGSKMTGTVAPLELARDMAESCLLNTTDAPA
ncbi:TetR/AcrR family transcriptional regulator [Corynebacterium ulceribovis]|uniref:TetR/AcrR family transcriptional regulator n=1 Tax=Corynebacterium ulceribovis TaxID=487732 RepID=UPI00036951D3|nr:TetR/AcrR family transcriptional regulator [Corynebacterium ulceribovis]